MKINLEENITVVTPKGEINFWNSNGIKESIKESIGKNMTNILVDMTQVEFIDSSGAGMLVSLSKFADKKSGKLSLCKLNEDVDFVIRVSKLDRLFKIYSDRETALREMS